MFQVEPQPVAAGQGERLGDGRVGEGDERADEEVPPADAGPEVGHGGTRRRTTGIRELMAPRPPTRLNPGAYMSANRAGSATPRAAITASAAATSSRPASPSSSPAATGRRRVQGHAGRVECGFGPLQVPQGFDRPDGLVGDGRPD